MCSSVYIDNGKTQVECTSQSELSIALGLKSLPLAGNTKASPESCLCPVDIKKAAHMCGYSYTYDYMDYYFKKNVGKKKKKK